MCPEVNIPAGHPALSPVRADLADAIQMPTASEERITELGRSMIAGLPPVKAAGMHRVIDRAVELSIQS